MKFDPLENEPMSPAAIRAHNRDIAAINRGARWWIAGVVGGWCLVAFLLKYYGVV